MSHSGGYVTSLGESCHGKTMISLFKQGKESTEVMTMTIYSKSEKNYTERFPPEEEITSRNDWNKNPS